MEIEACLRVLVVAGVDIRAKTEDGLWVTSTIVPKGAYLGRTREQSSLEQILNPKLAHTPTHTNTHQKEPKVVLGSKFVHSAISLGTKSWGEGWFFVICSKHVMGCNPLVCIARIAVTTPAQTSMAPISKVAEESQ